MRFTKKQYEVAIQALKDASTQLEPDGHCCACCGDSGHQAMECGFNPLVAMALCEDLAREAHELYRKLESMKLEVAKQRLHDIVYWTAGFEFRMGQQVGPAKIKLPEES